MQHDSRIKIAGSITLAATPMVASAADAPSKKLNPWVDCGIGAMIFTDTGWAAAISNVIWDLGTTAVTSNLSTPETCGSSNAKVAMLVGTSYASLEEETIKGSGKHMTAMLKMMNCNPASHNEIIRVIRSDFSQALRSDANYLQKAGQARAEEYYNLVQAKVSGEFAQQCQAI